MAMLGGATNREQNAVSPTRARSPLTAFQRASHVLTLLISPYSALQHISTPGSSHRVSSSSLLTEHTALVPLGGTGHGAPKIS